MKKDRSLRQKIQEIARHPESRFAVFMAWALQFFVFLSLVGVSLETLPNLSPFHQKMIRVFEITIVGIFTVEYGIRVWIAENRRKYIFSFFGMIDLLAILPFYLTLSEGTSILRAVRLLQIFRILKIARFSAAVTRFSDAFSLAKEEMILFLSSSLLILYFSAAGIYYFEHGAQPEKFQSIFHSLWWAVVTLTTVGYGDVYPITLGGRVFTFIILMIGLGVIGIPAGLIASALSTVRLKELQRANDDDKNNKPKG